MSDAFGKVFGHLSDQTEAISSFCCSNKAAVK